MNAIHQPFPIQTDPAKMSGVPTIRDQRMPVEYLFRYGVPEFKQAFPHVSDDDIEAVITATVGLLEEHCRELNRQHGVPTSRRERTRR